MAPPRCARACRTWRAQCAAQTGAAARVRRGGGAPQAAAACLLQRLQLFLSTAQRGELLAPAPRVRRRLQPRDHALGAHPTYCCTMAVRATIVCPDSLHFTRDAALSSSRCAACSFSSAARAASMTDNTADGRGGGSVTLLQRSKSAPPHDSRQQRARRVRFVAGRPRDARGRSGRRPNSCVLL